MTILQWSLALDESNETAKNNYWRHVTDKSAALEAGCTLAQWPLTSGLRPFTNIKGKGSPYSITERRVQELIPVLGSQPAGDVSHKPGGRLPLLASMPAVTPATLKRAATNFAAWWTEAQWCEQFAYDCYPTALRLRFKPGPFCAWVKHANHSATEPPIHYSINSLNPLIYCTIFIK